MRLPSAEGAARVGLAIVLLGTAVAKLLDLFASRALARGCVEDCPVESGTCKLTGTLQAAQAVCYGS